MLTATDPWSARVAVALAVASRWPSAVSLALTLLGVARLLWPPPLGWPVLLALSLIVAAGAFQVYLALRIEFDCRLFAALATPASTAAELDRLDQALQALALLPAAKAGRDRVSRVQGLQALVRRAGWVTAVQFALVLTLPWLA